MRYLQIDWFMSDKKEYGHGFCNSKTALAFRTKAEAQEYLKNTYDLSAKFITRKQALKYAEYGHWGQNNFISFYENMHGEKKGIRIFTKE